MLLVADRRNIQSVKFDRIKNDNPLQNLANASAEYFRMLRTLMTNAIFEEGGTPVALFAYRPPRRNQ